jgi:DNA invertase Pin-like site-specific DNA recombinase
MQNFDFTWVYAYIRFSSDAQADGFSFERQREAVYAWTRSYGIADERVEFIEDAGYSAFTGAHMSRGALGKLLKRLQDSPREGNELVLFEAVDRSSREGPFLFSYMVGSFLAAGVFIHFLDERHPFSRNYPADPTLQLKLTIYASVAQQESSRKSIFSTNNWKNKRRAAQQDGTIITKECPRWLSVEEGKFVVDEERVEAIHAVFHLAKTGWGIGKIVRYANEWRWPVPGNGEVWHNSLLNRLFANRALLGEFQPHIKRDGKKVPEGEPISDYYPRVVDSDLFYAVRAVRSTIAQFPNRRDEHNYNYLQGLGRCECGGTWRRVNKQSGKQRGYAQYSCSNRQNGLSKCENLPAKYFDHHFIVALCKNIPDFLAKIRSSTVDQGAAISDELGDIESRLVKLLDSLELNGDPAGLVTNRISSLVERKGELLQERERLLIEPISDSATFSMTEALSLYIPAFLDNYDGDSEESLKAFQARALFRSRLLSVVEQVTVSLSRTNINVLLKNREKLPLTIAHPKDVDDAGYGISPDDVGENDFDIEGDRRILEELEKTKIIY